MGRESLIVTGVDKTTEVLERVGDSMKGQLKAIDYESQPSGRMLRWRNTAQWAVNSMVNEAVLKDGMPRSEWKISEEGEGVSGGTGKLEDGIWLMDYSFAN